MLFEILKFWWVIFPKNPSNFDGSRGIPAKMKKSNNLYAVEDRQNMSIDHDYKLWVTLSE